MKKIILSLLISTLALAISAQGAYLEFKITTDKEGISGTTKIYAEKGNTRSQIIMSNPQIPGGFRQASLMLQAQPGRVYQLDEEHKTYTQTDLPQAQREEAPDAYDISIVGPEKANGYPATHIAVKRKGSATIEDMWVSTAVAGYQEYTSINSQYLTMGFFKAMAAKGIKGFPVRIKMSQRGTTMQIDLSKAESRHIEPALFSLAGYKKTEPAAQESMSNDMISKIQNMSPEERQKFIDQMRKQQQQAPQSK